MIAKVNLDLFSPFLLFGKKNNTPPIAQTLSLEESKGKAKPKGIIVGKYEFAEGKLKFYIIKGVFKKRWVAIKEFPAVELTNVESIENGLAITWNGATYYFLHQKKSESFSGLRDQILALLAEQKQTVEKKQKQSQLKADLVAALNSTLGIVDLTFDILTGLHAKRVNWQILNAYSQRLMGGVSWTGQILPPLKVDPSKVLDAITKQVPKEVSKEALGVLKVIYDYFNCLPNKEYTTENSEIFENAKNAMTNYLILNDVMFARVIGQKDDPEELAALGNAFSMLIDESNIKISLDSVASSIIQTRMTGREVDADNFREIFREKFALL
jgi:hypothetical protein